MSGIHVVVSALVHFEILILTMRTLSASLRKRRALRPHRASALHPRLGPSRWINNHQSTIKTLLEPTPHAVLLCSFCQAAPTAEARCTTRVLHLT